MRDHNAEIRGDIDNSRPKEATMTSMAQPTLSEIGSPRRWMLWTGRVLSALPALLMVFSASMKLSHAPSMLESWTGRFGFQENALTGIGLLELACVVLYVVPRTSVLGVVLMTGYLGGAIVTHVRIGDASAIMPFVLGVIAWAGLYLRETRLHTLLPLRKRA
jgi:hypothetical protein